MKAQIFDVCRRKDMKLCVRAHDLGVKGSKEILMCLDRYDLDGVQLVCYKSYEDIPYDRGGITEEKAKEIGDAFRDAGKDIAMIGAYFNPVHSNIEKRERCRDVFAEYLAAAKTMGTGYVGSETGSFNDDVWTYHPNNRTEEARTFVRDTFKGLAEAARENGVSIAMEGAAGHVNWCPQVLKKTVDEINMPNVKVIFDLYNYLDQDNQHNWKEILEEGLELFKGKILLFHMKDWLYTTEGRPKQVNLGTGEADLETILKMIKAYDEDAVLVLEGTKADGIEHAVKTVRRIWNNI